MALDAEEKWPKNPRLNAAVKMHVQVETLLYVGPSSQLWQRCWWAWFWSTSVLMWNTENTKNNHPLLKVATNTLLSNPQCFNEMWIYFERLLPANLEQMSCFAIFFLTSNFRHSYLWLDCLYSQKRLWLSFFSFYFLVFVLHYLTILPNWRTCLTEYLTI